MGNSGFFGSDHSRAGSQKNGELEIWHSSSPFGPWRPHKKNPVNNMDKSMGARNGGRPFMYNGSLYRIGQDCGQTYGHKIRIFKVEVLTIDEFVEVEVPSGIVAESMKGRSAWNGVRNHHIDVQQLSSGKWIAVVDGDRVPSGDTMRRFVIGSLSVTAVAALVIFLGVLLGVVHCTVPLSSCHRFSSGKKSEAFLAHDRSSSNLLSCEARPFWSHMCRATTNLRARIRPNSSIGVTVLLSTFLIAAALTYAGVCYLYGGNGAQEAYPLNGHFSQFTLMAMSYDARRWNLKMYVKHYSRCSSVREIVVVWNKGVPPHPGDFDSAVPVRIRVEKHNSLNNRFKVDHLIKTRAVLQLDDGIIMSCNDIERGFLVWRQNPNKIVGFFPRLVSRKKIKYSDENYARRQGGYNMILTGAAFLDARAAFARYWSRAADKGRAWVDKTFNCEDMLMNFVYANATTTSSSVVEYVKPGWLLETSKLSGVAISKNMQAEYEVRTKCLSKFSEIYGPLRHQRSEFGRRKDGWDV